MIPKLSVMFTGIVQTKGTVAAIDRNAFGVRLTIDTGDWVPAESRAVVLGDSIACGGVCLTVAGISDGAAQTDGRLAFDVIAETLDKTTLGGLEVGSEVNLEPAVTANQPMGGHFVQGHVDGVGVITDVVASDEEWRVTIEPPVSLQRYCIPKGSVTIDGVSLTLAAVNEHTFEVALIPTTLEVTTLGRAKVGGRVNLEADILTKTLVHTIERMQGVDESGDGTGEDTAGEGVTMEQLKDAGFAS